MLGSWSGDASAVCTHFCVEPVYPGRGVWRRKACTDLVEREHGPCPPPCARVHHPRPAGCGTQSGRAIKHQQNECRAATVAPSSFRSWALADAGIDAADATRAMSLGPDVLSVSSRVPRQRLGLLSGMDQWQGQQARWRGMTPEFAPNVDVRTRLAASAVQTGWLAIAERAGASRSLPVNHPGDRGCRGGRRARRVSRCCGQHCAASSLLLTLTKNSSKGIVQTPESCYWCPNNNKGYVFQLNCHWGGWVHGTGARNPVMLRIRGEGGIGTYRSCWMITNRTLALLRLVPAHLLDQLATAPNQVAHVKHEQYGSRLVGYLEPHALLRNSEWDVDSYVSYLPSFRLGAAGKEVLSCNVMRDENLMRTPFEGQGLAFYKFVERVIRSIENGATEFPMWSQIEPNGVVDYQMSSGVEAFEDERYELAVFKYFRIRSLYICFVNPKTWRSWCGPSQVVYIKHKHSVGLVGNLAELADVVPPRLLFHLAIPDRDTAKRISCMAVVDVSYASDESVGSGAIIASLYRGSRGEGWEDQMGMDSKRTESCRLCDEADALLPDLFEF
ncbi:hypothetical protein EDB83DRAFT_2556920 [Lactarius deliciosus]|nr:hypothetical protein EDB83DRAFT_2556920 [Lactarius deliciosus]